MAVLEIFNKVLDSASLSDRARCARVCKSWRDAALDRVWEDACLQHLLEVLAPIKVMEMRTEADDMLETLVSGLPFLLWCAASQKS